MENLPTLTPVVKKIKVNEITASLSSSRVIPPKRTMPLKRSHREIADNSPVPTSKLQKLDSTPTDTSLIDLEECKKSPDNDNIFTACIPHHYHTLQDHEIDDDKAFARVKRLLSAISTAKPAEKEEKILKPSPIKELIVPIPTKSIVSPVTSVQSTESKPIPSFNSNVMVPPLVSQPSVAPTNVVSFNSSTPASTLNHLSALAGNMVGSPGTFFSVGSTPSGVRKAGSRSSRRSRR